MTMLWRHNDGGRSAAGFKGSAGDCVVRAICIATERPYREVYDACALGMESMRRTTRRNASAGRRSARNGVYMNAPWFKRYMVSLGFVWTPTMQIGQGCHTHLTENELPSGRLVVRVSKHATAVIDGVIHDTHDPQRLTIEEGVIDGVPYRKEYHRCVYGYWTLKK